MHAELLKKYWSAFNGKKVVTVAIDERTDDLGRVMSMIDMKGIIWRVIDNNRSLGETAGFADMLDIVKSVSEDEFTFYCHGKGVGYMDLAKRIWCESMYYFNLSSQTLTETVLRSHDAAGCYQWKNRQHGGSNWHYSGTFFWFKNSAVFSKEWRQIESNIYGVEGWIGRHVTQDRAFSFIDPPDSLEFKNRWIEPVEEINEWNPKNAISRFSAIKRGMVAWMKRVMSDRGVVEHPAAPHIFKDSEYVSK